MLQDIPFELRQLSQWVCVDMTLDEKGHPKKAPLNPRTGQLASVDDPETWGTFDEAIQTANPVIGFVLSDNDPYAIIDLDNKPSNPATPEQLERHNKIIQAFQSYTELSISGTGVHIIVKGKVPKGKNRDHVEVYSTGRYMICTGHTLNSYPIKEHNELLNILWNEMERNTSTKFVNELHSKDSHLSDAKLIERASNAANGEKFDKLCNGEWQGDYPSQSEADFALLSMFCFYSKDNQQCIRLFRMSKLGKRDKAQRDEYFIGPYGMLNKIRANEVKDVNLDAIMEKARRLAGLVSDESEVVQEEEVVRDIEPQVVPEMKSKVPPAPKKVPKSPPKVPKVPEKPKRSYSKKLTYPPGLIGEMAEYFYATSIRPVKEISILAALALVAGVAGRAFNVSGSGLNQYLILLARTGSGKEGAAKAIEHLITAVRPQVPAIDQFIGPAAFSSGQALVKTLDTKPCFISVLGEFGLTLQQISDQRATSAEKMFKKVLLDLYGKSGHFSILRSSVYSDSDKNTSAITAPNVTILGESTPDTFFETLDQSHIAEGLIPRFSIIEYTGDRPNRNRNSNHPPTQELAQRFASLVAVSLNLQNKKACVPVQIDTESMELLDTFDETADNLINNAKNDVEMQLWNRAHLKALKLAALLAVGANPNQPIITQELALWAIEFVKLDINTIVSRFSAGDVGLGDNKQSFDMKQIFNNYATLNDDLLRNYQVPVNLWKAGIIPFSYISRRCSAMAAFRKDRTGSRRAITETLKALVEQGYVVEIPSTQIEATFGIRAKCYGVGDML